MSCFYHSVIILKCFHMIPIISLALAFTIGCRTHVITTLKFVTVASLWKSLKLFENGLWYVCIYIYSCNVFLLDCRSRIRSVCPNPNLLNWSFEMLMHGSLVPFLINSIYIVLGDKICWETRRICVLSEASASYIKREGNWKQEAPLGLLQKPKRTNTLIISTRFLVQHITLTNHFH